MERLEQDLRYFMYEIKQENDSFRRNLLLQEVVRVQKRISDLIQQERGQMEQEMQNMSVLSGAESRKNKFQI